MRQKSVICIVENVKDMLTIEHNGQFSGGIMFLVEQFLRLMVSALRISIFRAYLIIEKRAISNVNGILF